MRTLGPAEYLTSALLARAGFRHAFFTRGGGVSTGPYSSLNFSYAVGDRPEDVDENLRRAAQALAVPAEHVYFLAQVHGSTVVELSDRQPHREVLSLEGDALVSGAADVACGVRTADCVPVLVADQSTGRVAAIHAGWRGVVAAVVPAALAALGGQPSNWIAAIGPHISAQRFEVSDDVATELESASSADCVVRHAKQKPHVNLRLATRGQLLAHGMPNSAVDDVFGCTNSDPLRFFSFRRDGKLSGRHLSAIVPRG
jgi:YfiH family protein